MKVSKETKDPVTGFSIIDREFPITFRWPITQTNDKQVVVHIPISEDAPPIIAPSSITYLRNTLKLSDMEVERMLDVAEEAAIKEILIVR